MPDVSVVIPTFRRPQLLLQAIDSALGQAGVSVEVLVVDDSPEGSARESVSALGDARVSYIKHEPPTGGRPAVVRNSAWPRARGRFVHFLDDDDRAASGYYRAAVEAFDSSGCGVVFGQIEPFADGAPDSLQHERAFFENATRRARFASRVPSRRWLVANLLFKQTLLVNSACLIRRECVAALGGYNPQVGLNEDVDFFCRAIRSYGFEFLDQVVLHYRILPDSLIHGRKDNEKLIQSYYEMQRCYRQAHGATELFALKALARTLLRAT
ncbi:MAG: glycosyltransferase family 2 protein [Polyangiaceae bacterium]